MQRVRADQRRRARRQGVVLNATGYIVAAHKIQVAVEGGRQGGLDRRGKGDRVKQGQVLVRLEDDEYRAQLQQAKGSSPIWRPGWTKLLNGSRPEEIAQAHGQRRIGQSRSGERPGHPGPHQRPGRTNGVLAKQALDDAQARYDSARCASVELAAEDLRTGEARPAQGADRRRCAARSSRRKGAVAYAETQARQHRDPRAGDRHDPGARRGEGRVRHHRLRRRPGAKGYVVSLADLNDLRSGARHQPERFRQARSRASTASSPPTPFPTASTTASSTRSRPKPTGRRRPCR